MTFSADAPPDIAGRSSRARAKNTTAFIEILDEYLGRTLDDSGAARLLAEFGAVAADCIVLHRFVPPLRYATSELEQLRGVFVDVETTGLDPERDEIIQLALVPFGFTREGIVCDVGPATVMLEEPTREIPELITRLTGITDADVAGRKISDEEVQELVAGAALVVAHHAEFDRRFLEKRFPIFERLRFGCSMEDIPWADEGAGGTKLEWLLFKHCGMFCDAHDAGVDAAVGVHLLSTTLPSGRRALACVLDAARQTWCRVWAVGAPFQTRHVLKAKGYRWNGGEDGRPKAWWIDVRLEAFREEREWLGAAVREFQLRVDRFDARQRFSNRVGS